MVSEDEEVILWSSGGKRTRVSPPRDQNVSTSVAFAGGLQAGSLMVCGRAFPMVGPGGMTKCPTGLVRYWRMARLACSVETRSVATKADKPHFWTRDKLAITQSPTVVAGLADEACWVLASMDDDVVD